MPDGIDGDVPDLTAVAGDARQRATVDDDAAADTDLARDIEHVVRAEGGSPARLGQGAEVGLVGDGHGYGRLQRGRQPFRERDVGPAEVGGRANEPVGAPDDTSHGHADADEGLGFDRSGPDATDEAGEVANDGIDGAVAPRTIDAPCSMTSPAGPTWAAARESTAISRARTETRSRSRDTTGDGRPGTPSGAGRSSVTRPAATELADVAADGAPGQARARDELGAGERPASVEGANDRAQVGAPDGLAALAALKVSHRRWVAPLVHRFVFVSFKCRAETLPCVHRCQARR